MYRLLISLVTCPIFNVFSLCNYSKNTKLKLEIEYKKIKNINE